MNKRLPWACLFSRQLHFADCAVKWRWTESCKLDVIAGDRCNYTSFAVSTKAAKIPVLRGMVLKNYSSTLPFNQTCFFCLFLVFVQQNALRLSLHLGAVPTISNWGIVSNAVGHWYRSFSLYDCRCWIPKSRVMIWVMIWSDHDLGLILTQDGRWMQLTTWWSRKPALLWTPRTRFEEHISTPYVHCTCCELGWTVGHGDTG